MEPLYIELRATDDIEDDEDGDEDLDDAEECGMEDSKQ